LISITSLERTLIDIAVRPDYSGGPGEVLKAFENAKEKVSINKLNAILKKINFIYPYHQVIGFYLERAGYRASQIDLLRKKEIEYDFYLTYNMGETEYSPIWKLYYPKGF
jgi:predicted transcriptional regulator of viral defense system